jgi:hypothetical protein
MEYLAAHGRIHLMSEEAKELRPVLAQDRRSIRMSHKTIDRVFDRTALIDAYLPLQKVVFDFFVVPSDNADFTGFSGF